ncbi:tryptophan-rich sensory protein [Chryseobacterium sp. H3056]|uniref:Tryptophan-rich sensory protein n=1 Tax=Kaistella daneshvariae TaxID=2487074 RepID=A0A3N0WZ80_9FLAO|nr:tryptophan-rich sensory protein [Kaistella daneshvariae]ROI10444.1 tryptophan-rich sensory protein [Kaistella daneshvariae]
MKKTLQIANGFALVFTIIFNYLSNTGIFGGKTIGDVSDEYKTLITPAGYAFSIWGLIYLLMLVFVIYTGRSLFKPEKNDTNEFIEKIGWWFVLSCVANCSWIVVWLYGYAGFSVLILVIAMISLLMILIPALDFAKSGLKKCLINVPFQIYAGWMSVALIVATASWLKKIGWNGFGIPEAAWTIILISIATVIHLLMTWRKNTPFFAFVGAWAFVAIAMSNSESNSTVYTFALAAVAVLVVSSVIHLFKFKTATAQP